MKYKVAILLLSVAILACGTVGTVATQTVATTTATVNPSKTPQEAPQATETAKPIQSPTPTLLAVLGCWNIRSGPGEIYEIKRVQCGGELLPLENMRGWVYVADGWICGRAFGMDACE